MKKTIKLFLLSVIFPFYCYTQTTITYDNNLLKYWFYRNRLKYFVIPGSNIGENEVAGIRNRDNLENLNFPQLGIQMGYYLGVLATEYKLLYDNQRYAEATKTKDEIHKALLYAYIRDLDKSEYGQVNFGDNDYDDPSLYPTNYEDYNGFSVDENVSCDFLNQYTVDNKLHSDVLNKNLIINNQYDPGSHSITGVPDGHPGWIDEIFDCTNNPPSPMGQDDAIGLIMGLALVYKFVPDESTLAAQITRRKIMYIYTSFNLYGPHDGSQHDRAYEMWKPDGTLVGNGNCYNNSYGIAKAGTFFGWPLCYFWRGDDCDIDQNSYMTAAGSTSRQITWSGQWYFQPGPSYNQAMAATLAAIGDSWNFAAQGILNNTNDHGWAPFYLLLWAVLHDKYSNSHVENNVEEALTDINSAPCEGPYYFDDHHANFDGWAYLYKWRGYTWEQWAMTTPPGELRTSGVYNGMDYMLLYNLYQIYLANRDNATFYDQNYVDLDFPYNLPIYNTFPNFELGTDAVPWTFLGFESITSNKVVDVTTYDLNSNPNGYSKPADVSFRAGEEIHLLPGFHAVEGSHFHAYIEHINCDAFYDYSQGGGTKYAQNDNEHYQQQNNRDSLITPDGYSFSSFPNPFSSTTNINYTIPSNGNIKISVTNSFGVNVGEILNEQKQAGTYDFVYDATGLSPDIYYLTLATENYRKTIKMVLMKE